jgi:hypothetical protein
VLYDSCVYLCIFCAASAFLRVFEGYCFALLGLFAGRRMGSCSGKEVHATLGDVRHGSGRSGCACGPGMGTKTRLAIVMGSS